MKNYESPTIEQAGGSGNELEPQVVFLLPDFAIASEFMYIWIWHEVTGVPYPPYPVT